jgi:arylsulfatase A-like enzyme
MFKLILKSILQVMLTLVAAVGEAADKPNVVYILVDNWGWGGISLQGGTTPSPRIEALAAEGVRMTNFNVQNQCTPTRSAILTGRLPIRSGTQKVARPGEPNGMSPWEYTIAELLSDAGYATALYGKWHIGDTEGRLPNDQGFDEWYGIKGSAMMASYTATPQFDPDVFDVPQIWRGSRGRQSKKVKPFNLESRATLDAEVVTKTSSFIKKQARLKRPSYVHAALTQIHPPYLPHPDFIGKSRAGDYADIRVQLDSYVGEVLDAIEQAELATSMKENPNIRTGADFNGYDVKQDVQQ